MRKLKVPDHQNSYPVSPDDDLQIDPMKLSDLEEIMKIEKQSFVSPWSRSHFVQEIQQNPLSHPYILRKKEGEKSGVVGFVVCWIVNGELHINNLAVRLRCRRRGFGEILMRFALEFGEANRCRKAFLEVRRSNRTAIQLYEKLGFAIIGEAPCYYEDTNEDAYLLEKKL